MPKLKSHRGAMKRFKISKKGKLKRPKAFASHLKSKKPAKRRRRLKQGAVLDKSDKKRIKKLLPS